MLANLNLRSYLPKTPLPSRRRTGALAVFALLALPALPACETPDSPPDGDADAVESVAEATQPIVNGTPVANPENSTVVAIYAPGFFDCTGTLLTNDWVLTAAHCNLAAYAPSSITIQLGNVGAGATQTRPAAFIVNHPSLDFALVRVKSPFSVNGSLTGFKRGLYESSTASLTGKKIIGYGYSSGVCIGCQDVGFLRSMERTANGNFDQYNWNSDSIPGDQYTVYGDSGGPAMRATSAGTFVTGVLKGPFYGLPENFRDWVTSYLYARPIAMPTTWFIYDAIVPYSGGVRLPAGPFPGNYTDYVLGNVQLWDKPLLKNNFDVKARLWDPCPGSTYTWQASYNLEQGYDWIEIATKDPANPNQLKTTHLTGVNGSGIITGKGDVWVDVHTDVSVQSAGIGPMSFRCKSALEFSNPWPSPLPNNTNSAAPSWDPCPGGDAFTWTATYAFQPGDKGAVGYTPNPEFPEPVVTELTGSGTTSGVSYGPTDVSVFTDGANPSTGITSLSAVCSMAIECHGARCFTLPDVLPNSAGPGIPRSVSRMWNPCNGGSFTWTAKHNLENLFDIGKVGNQTFTGQGTTSGTATGSVVVQVSTDVSVQSAGFDVTAVCDAWASSP